LRRYSLAKKLQSQKVTREKPHKTILYKKVASKMLMELTPVFLFLILGQLSCPKVSETFNIALSRKSPCLCKHFLHCIAFSSTYVGLRQPNQALHK